MVAVFADASSNAQVRTSAGALNDAATWTPALDIGYADYPRLAGGSSGLFLLSGTPENALTVRKFDGTTFNAGVKIADVAEDAQAHLTEDPGGRLHAVFAHGTAAGLELDYATSDNGTTWQSGPLLTQTDATQGFGALRAATAPDHIGVAAWETSSGGSSQVRVLGIGPEGGVSPPVPGKSVAIGLVSGKVFYKSPTGGHAAQGRRDDSGRQPDRHAARPRGADLGRHGHRHHDAEVRLLPGHVQGPPERAQGQPCGGADHGHHPRRRGLAVAVRVGAGRPRGGGEQEEGAARGARQAVGQRQGQVPHNGKYSSATVRGTIWLTSDRCDGTLTTVRRGTVSVRDLRRHKTVTVKAGHSYLARARR